MIIEIIVNPSPEQLVHSDETIERVFVYKRLVYNTALILQNETITSTQSVQKVSSRLQFLNKFLPIDDKVLAGY